MDLGVPTATESQGEKGAWLLLEREDLPLLARFL